MEGTVMYDVERANDSVAQMIVDLTEVIGLFVGPRLMQSSRVSGKNDRAHRLWPGISLPRVQVASILLAPCQSHHPSSFAAS
jgi:hypothetical protein